MPTARLFSLLICAAPSALFAQVNPGTAQGDVSVTIYSNDLALVQDVRQLNIKAGTNSLEFPDVSAQIRPETVSFSAEGASIVEPTFDFDLLSPDKLMETTVGQNVTTVVTQSASRAAKRQQARGLAGHG